MYGSNFQLYFQLNVFCVARNDVSHAGVQYIIDSVIDALDVNPDRRFIYAEIAYFWRWWNQQNDDTRNKVRDFVNSGQIKTIIY